MKRTFGKLLVFTFALVMTLSLAQAQFGRGRIRGSVHDTEGNPIEGATVTAKDTRTSGKRTATTDKKGDWRIAGLASGEWEFTAEKEGYESFSTKVKIKELGRNLPIKFKLAKMVKSSFAGVPTGPSPEDEEAAEALKKDLELVKKGGELYDAGKYEEAAQQFLAFLEKHPNTHIVHVNVGNSYYQLGQYSKAREEYLKVLEHDPKNADILKSIANTYLGENDVENAKKYLQQAVDIKPDADAYFSIGMILLKARKGKDAVEFLSKAVEMKPDWADVYLQLGYANMQAGDSDKALAAFKKYLELAPDAADAAEVKQYIEMLSS